MSGAAGSAIQDLVTGYARSAVLFAAAEIGLFEALVEGPAGVDVLASRLDASPDGVARLCAALVALGVIERDDRGHYSADPAALRILAGPGGMGPLLRHHLRHLWPLLGDLAAAVRSGAPRIGAWTFAPPAVAATGAAYDALSRDPGEFALFLDAMEVASRGVGADLAAVLDLSGVRRIVDLGGGSGVVARELLHAYSDLVVETIDLPAACARCAARSEPAGLLARHHVTAADLTSEAPLLAEPGDAVLLSAVLADFDAATQRRMLRHAASVLRPGGLLIVSETLLDDDEQGPVLPALLSLLMLVAMRGRNFTAHGLQALLESSGYVDVRVQLRRDFGRRDIITARLPVATRKAAAV